MKIQRVIFVSVLSLLLASTALASTVNSLAVAANQLTIAGSGFSGTPVTVILGGHSLPIVSRSPTTIVAVLSPVPAPGSYRVVVKTGSVSTSGFITISASPVIVAQVSLKGQTAAIPITALFTPPSDGLYRIAAYGVVTVPSGNFGQWDVQLNWTDDGGSELCSNYQPCLLMLMNSLYANPVESRYGVGIGSYGPFSPNTTSIVQVKAGVPVTYSVVPDANGNPAGSTYELFITVEQLM